MDGRKNNRGTLGNKGGRPPKADEVAMIERMDAALAPDDVWNALAAKVKEKNVHAIKCWLNYRYGIPNQRTELELNDNDPIIVNIVGPDFDSLDN